MTAWTCPNCNADVDDGFDSCWQCGTSTDGEVDPAFVREVDVATLPPNWISRIKCESCAYTGKALIGHDGYQWWTLPLAIFLSCSLIGVIPWFFIFLLMGNRTFKACPNCENRDRLIDWDGGEDDPSPESEEIWKTKQAADHRAFKNNKLTLLAVVSVVFVFSLLSLILTMTQW